MLMGFYKTTTLSSTEEHKPFDLDLLALEKATGTAGVCLLGYNFKTFFWIRPLSWFACLGFLINVLLHDFGS